MEEGKESDKNLTKSDFVKWFSEVNKDSGAIVGGKGANLAEMFNLKIAVPNGFVVTAQAYDYFLKKAGIRTKIREILETINYEDTTDLDKKTKEIRDLITKSEFPNEVKTSILEAYDSLDVDGFDFEKGSALEILNTSSEPPFVAVRSSATTEDLEGASFAGQQDTYINVKGNQKVIDHVKKCFASLFTSRATYYRNKKGFDHDKASLAVVIQIMIDADKSGVIFTKDPSYKNEHIIIESVWGLGEGIVSGKVTPDRYIINRDFEIQDKIIATKNLAITRNSAGDKIEVKLIPERANAQVLKNHEIKKLASLALDIEKHYGKPQDIEFTIEGDEISIVQTRPITTIENRVEEKVTDEKINQMKEDSILEGIPASPGIASGRVKIIRSMNDLNKIEKGDILVTEMTNPDMVVTMQKSSAIVTNEGGLTAHAAIVSREMGIPCIVGTKDATEILKENSIVTVDGFKGKVYSGKVADNEKKEILPVTAITKTEIKVIVDLPTFAHRSAKTNLKKIGLTRIEGIISEGKKHPQYFLKENKMEEYEELVFNGLKKISEHFEEIWVRTSDIRTDEFQDLEGAPEVEANPMLGMHGIRFGLKNKPILVAELKALQKISKQNKKVGIILPQVISVKEVQDTKKILQEINFNEAKLGIMIETPAAVQIIGDLCSEGIDFVSFGTNDLTQYILAIDRGNTLVQEMYDEMHPAVLNQIQYALRTCKRNNIQTSICGQAGSKKEMVKFLIKNKIDSISVNADVAKEISDYVYELENSNSDESNNPPKHNFEKENKNNSEFKIQDLEEKINLEKETIKKIENENKIEGEENIEEKPNELNEEEEEIKKYEEDLELRRKLEEKENILSQDKSELEKLQRELIPEEENEKDELNKIEEEIIDEDLDELINNVEKIPDEEKTPVIESKNTDSDIPQEDRKSTPQNHNLEDVPEEEREERKNQIKKDEDILDLF